MQGWGCQAEQYQMWSLIVHEHFLVTEIETVDDASPFNITGLETTKGDVV